MPWWYVVDRVLDAVCCGGNLSIDMGLGYVYSWWHWTFYIPLVRRHLVRAGLI